MTESWDRIVDVVIVGSGGGSMVAALKAKQLGLEALIIEKQALIGGSTGFSGGVLWVPANHLMKRDGVPDNLQAGRRYVDAAAPYFGPGGTSERRDAYLQSGPEMVSFLEAAGLAVERPPRYPDYYTTKPGASEETRCISAKLFDVNELGSWKDRLSTYPMTTLPIAIGEMSPLLLAKRTWSAKILALRVGYRVLKQKLTGTDYRGAGAALQGRMLKLSVDKGVEFLTETPFESFVTEEGRVIGVVARHEGNPYRIKARLGVIANSGGFARNAAMRPSPVPQGAADRTLSNPGETGEVLSAAIKLGAAVDCMEEAIWTLVSLGPNESLPPGALLENGTVAHFSHHWDIAFPHCIIVDPNGKRIGNEAGSYMEFGQRLHDRHRETGGPVPAWAIIESRHRKRYLWGRHMGATPQEWFDSGYMIKAQSLDDLAEKTGISAENLKSTVARFNKFAAQGRDDDFQRGEAGFDRFHGDPTNKPNPNLGAIEKPPFYAVRLYSGDVGTVGGVVADVDGRALRSDGSVIEGLFVSGNCAAPPFGKSYIGAGTSIAGSMIFAYRAVIAMAAQDPKAHASSARRSAAPLTS
jgi:3-oxosteroid 1-dehydrogenase